MQFEKDVLTTGEVAKVCNVAPRTVSKWFDTGQLKGYRIPGSKDRRIPVGELVAFMRSHGIPLDALTGGQARVLIVDNDAETLEAIRRVLADQTDYEVSTASNPFAAGMECERLRPSVLLMDLHTGDHDARVLVDLIRSNKNLAGAKIIGMSAKLTDGQSQQLRAIGFDGFLKKPFQVRQLIDSINQAARAAA